MQENKHFLPIAVVVAGALIAGAIYFGGSNTPSTQVRGGTSTDTVEIAPVSSKDHIVGSPDAKVVIIEYSDTECPFCKIFHSTVSQVMDEYKGESVAWVYRHFPIQELHSKAPKEAEATECAAEQGGNNAFWSYLNKIFATTTSNDTLDPQELPRIAESIGLNVSSFNDCLQSNRYSEKIAKDIEAAYNAGAQGTPYTIVMSGKKKSVIVGAQDFNTMKSVIEPLLK